MLGNVQSELSISLIKLIGVKGFSLSLSKYYVIYKEEVFRVLKKTPMDGDLWKLSLHMYTVGLDKLEGLILYSQQSSEEKGTKKIERRGVKGKIIPFSSETKEIIFGCLLGDAKLEMPPRGVNARFGFTQAEAKKDYFISVFDSLSSLGSGNFRESSYIDKRTNKTYKNLNFWSKALPMLNEFYTNFYEGKIKIVPSDLSLLTPLALAHLIMQDGARGSSKGLYICTDAFSHEDVKRLTQYLIDRYNIKCSIHKVGGKPRIYILVKSVETVKGIVLPYMHPSMLYKLGI